MHDNQADNGNGAGKGLGMAGQELGGCREKDRDTLKYIKKIELHYNTLETERKLFQRNATYFTVCKCMSTSSCLG